MHGRNIKYRKARQNDITSKAGNQANLNLNNILTAGYIC